jgi:hypothetical protein
LASPPVATEVGRPRQARPPGLPTVSLPYAATPVQPARPVLTMLAWLD